MALAVRKRRGGGFEQAAVSVPPDVTELAAAELVTLADADGSAMILVRGPTRTFWIEIQDPTGIRGVEVTLPMAEHVAGLLSHPDAIEKTRAYLDALAVVWRSYDRRIADDEPESIRRGDHPAFSRPDR
ncbi:MAG: hypothetical protein ACJ790_09095 [Myxococcaceae bacterium]